MSCKFLLKKGKKAHKKEKKFVCSKHEMDRIYRILSFRSRRNTTELL